AERKPRRHDRTAGDRRSSRSARDARDHRCRARPVPRPRPERAPLLRQDDRTSPGDYRPTALMFGSAAKAFFHLLAQSRTLTKLATRWAMRSPNGFVHRFVPGETVEDAIRAARVLEAHGLTETFDHLGESVTTLAEAVAATTDYLK